MFIRYLLIFFHAPILIYRSVLTQLKKRCCDSSVREFGTRHRRGHCDVFFFFLFVKYVLSLLPPLLCVFAVFALTWGTSVVFLFLLSSVRKRKQCECLRARYFYSFCYLPTSRTKHSRKQTHSWTVQTTAQCTVLTARLLCARMVRMICLQTCSCDEVLVASRCYIVRAGALLLFPFCR